MDCGNATFWKWFGGADDPIDAMAAIYGPAGRAQFVAGAGAARAGDSALLVETSDWFDDERLVATQFQPAGERNCVAVIHQDVTELRRRLRERDDEDWRRDVHDLKNAIQPAIAYLEVLAMRVEGANDPVLAAAREALAAGAHAAADRAARPIVQTAPANAATQDVRGLIAMHAAARPDIAFGAELRGSDNAEIAYNGRALNRILGNLIENSIAHAWPDGGDKQIEIACDIVTTGLRLGYRDNGLGFRDGAPSIDEIKSFGGLGLQSILRLSRGVGWRFAFAATDSPGVHAILDIPLANAPSLKAH